MAQERLITLADVLQLLRLEELPARQLVAGDVAFLPRIGLVAVLEVLLSPETVTVVVDDVADSEHVLTLRPEELVPVAPVRRHHRGRPLGIPAPVEADTQGADDVRAEAALQRRKLERERPVSKPLARIHDDPVGIEGWRLGFEAPVRRMVAVCELLAVFAAVFTIPPGYRAQHHPSERTADKP